MATAFACASKIESCLNQTLSAQRQQAKKRNGKRAGRVRLDVMGVVWHPAGMRITFYCFPVVLLAEPRSTTGYNLPSLRLETAV